jgi:HPt (histidine-containing phosphotransfer) domain-containing protein
VEPTAVIRDLGGEYAELPIVALTANAVQGAREMFLANGFNGFISKPIDMSVLIEILKEWLPAERLGAEAPSEGSHAGTEIDESTDLIEDVRKICEINVEIGLGYFSGSKELYTESLDFLCRRLKTDCDTMSAQYEAKDLKGFAISAHTIKSKLATIGAAGLSDIAYKMEKDSKEEKFDVCTELFPDFLRKLISLHEQLAAIFSKEEAGKAPGDPACLREGISKALAFAGDFERDECLEIVNDLLTMDFGENVNGLLEKTLAALEGFDLDAAIGHLELLIKEGI